MHFQIALTSNMWPVLVAFRSASAESGWRKKEKRRRKRRICGKT